MSDRMTVEQWHEQLRKGIINVDIRHILWDWQGDRVELIAIADRRKEWATAWKNRAHLDNMRAFQWRQLATQRLELLREIEKFVQVCPICLIRIVDHPFEIHKKASGHAEGCELAKELAA